MENVKEEILKWVDRADNFGGHKSVVAHDKVIEIVTKLYTYSEVLDITEKVRQNCEYKSIHYVSQLDVNQFIPKK